MNWGQIAIIAGAIVSVIGVPLGLWKLWQVLQEVAVETSHLKRVPQLLEDVAKIKRDAQQAREQVKNSHTSNFREDMDAKHNEVIRHLTQQDRQIDSLAQENKAQWQAINTRGNP